MNLERALQNRDSVVRHRFVERDKDDGKGSPAGGASVPRVLQSLFQPVPGLEGRERSVIGYHYTNIGQSAAVRKRALEINYMLLFGSDARPR